MDPDPNPPGLDHEARAELESETRRHRESLAGLTPRDTGKVVAEANRHLDRVQAIMRALAHRATVGLNLFHIAVASWLYGA